MRNYVKGYKCFGGFTIVFTQEKCITCGFGQDEDDARKIVASSIDRMKQQLPGSDFQDDFTTDPEEIYLELDRLIIFRGMHDIIAGVILANAVDESQFLIADHGIFFVDIDYTDYLTDRSPKKVWSNGK